MKILKTAYYTACSMLPMALLKSFRTSTTLFPYHHTVSNEFLPHIKHLYNYKNERQFSNDLEILLKHFRPVTLEEISRSIVQHSRLPKRSFFLSFDDGFKEVFEVIAPILERKGVPALFFINPAFIDNKELFYRCKISLIINEILNNKDKAQILSSIQEIPEIGNRPTNEIIWFLKAINNSNAFFLEQIADSIGFSFNEYLQKKIPFLTKEQVKSLHKRGFSIGAHSMNHPYFQNITMDEQIKQIYDSCKFVNEIAINNNCCFSFPHSDRGLEQLLFNNVESLNIPLLFGIQNQKSEIKNKMLHRFNAERPEIDFSQQLKGMLLMIWFRNLVGRNDVVRK